jgi:ribosome biogenesis GTPase
VAQVVAANIDTVFVVTAFGFDLNPRRLERYLTRPGTAARRRSSSSTRATRGRSGVELLEIEPVTMGVPCTRSARLGDGLDELDAYLQPGRTVVLSARRELGSRRS